MRPADNVTTFRRSMPDGRSGAGGKARHGDCCRVACIGQIFVQLAGPAMMGWTRPLHDREARRTIQYFAKGTDLCAYTAEDLEVVAAALSARPRRALDGEQPQRRLTVCWERFKQALRQRIESALRAPIEMMDDFPGAPCGERHAEGVKYGPRPHVRREGPAAISRVVISALLRRRTPTIPAEHINRATWICFGKVESP